MRRRLLLSGLLFLTVASCYTNPNAWGDRPAPMGGGSRSVMAGTPCRVIARSRCSSDACKGANMDLVTYQCPNGRQSRCIANFTCTAQ